jgi:hypothetical protein
MNTPKKFTIEQEASDGRINYHSALHSPDLGHAEFTEFRMASELTRAEAEQKCAEMNANKPAWVWGYRVVENTNAHATP